MKKCRICKGTNLEKFLSLGDQPHCNSFLKADQIDQDEPMWPLDLVYCMDCHLVQLSCVVDPEVMFKDYVYVSGTTKTLCEHFRQSAVDLVSEFQLPNESLVVDIGSNDGTFLQQFKDLGMQVAGVDPASNIAKIANERGIETINDFFSVPVSKMIREQRGTASLITAAGVFFHIDDMDEVCKGIYELLDDKGILHVQAIYLGGMLEQTSYDNVYHEHVSYYTLRPLIHLFKRFDMSVFDVRHSGIHGGSLLLYVCKNGAYPIKDSVEKQLAYEHEKEWDTLEAYKKFSVSVQKSRDELVKMLKDLKANGKSIAAYTAPAKGNTLLNYCQIGTDILDCAVEKAPLKIGLYTPGMHIQVVDEDEAMKAPADYLLLLAWNFKDELLRKNQAYHDKGVKFIVPIPFPHIV